jgi:hypothetical protein
LDGGVKEGVAEGSVAVVATGMVVASEREEWRCTQNALVKGPGCEREGTADGSNQENAPTWGHK